MIFYTFLLFITTLNLCKCDQFDLKVLTVTGKYTDETEYTVNATSELVILFPPVSTTNPFRIITSSLGAKKVAPVLVVVRQAKQVSSWQLPTLVQSTMRHSELSFYTASKIMCHDDMASIVNPSDFRPGPLKTSQSFIVALSTSSSRNVGVVLKVAEEKNFYVELNKTYSLDVSPSEPKYVYFSSKNSSTDTVIIKIDSPDNICLTVSVQNSTCPVLDSNKDITYEGFFETVTTQGAITINKKAFKYGFFLVFVAKPDNYDCGQKKSIIPVPGKTFKIAFSNRTSVVTFSINDNMNYKDYLIVSSLTLLIFILMGIVLFIMTGVFFKWGALSKINLNTIDDQLMDSNPMSMVQVNKLLGDRDVRLTNLAMNPLKDTKKSFNYLWHICSIALFYSIPVVQLVVTYQRVVNQTGNQDLCYYNFMCAHPLSGISDLNHIFSNVGYVLTGLMFIFITLHRQARVPLRFEIGIPVHYGLYYAMGVALIIEGLLSASYHVCPTQSNYQFDTSFMYVMAVLCMVKLYHNRHPDINASAYATFSLLGLAIFFAMVGILNGTLTIWIIFVITYGCICLYLSFKVYFFSYILEGVKKFRTDITELGYTVDTLIPIKRGLFILLFIVNVVNFGMLISGILLYNSPSLDFGTFLLGLLMANSILHCFFYTAMKIIHKERICLEATIYGVLAIAFWCSASIYFFDAATLWTVTPAESRVKNQECIVADFYDRHDVWHLLSAPALFFTFMLLQCLDDDLINVHHREIEVF
ncbi:unnamed protein product [Brassicogethes aeneus]|uniref:SID1 transmembrane family member 1-like n=1 Tax=Brassicogethes aeneus TaxID=1431903 RepID=A0A9P0B4X0_BRAAE|nr:unnamed protein product [Brassicogethes aeneus]